MLKQNHMSMTMSVLLRTCADQARVACDAEGASSQGGGDDAGGRGPVCLRNYAYGHVEKIKVPAGSPQPGSPPTQKLRLRHERLELAMQALGLTSDDYVGWCGQSTAWWDHQRLGGSYEASAGHVNVWIHWLSRSDKRTPKIRRMTRAFSA